MSRSFHATPGQAADRLRSLLEEPAVAALGRLPAAAEAALVGGVVRDRLLGRPVRDIDAVVAGDGAAAARVLAELLKARAIRIGGDRFAAYRLEAEGLRLDLWDRAPMSLEEDLRRRDLTVNSMALRLGGFQLADPFGGLDDLERRRLRATTDRSFIDDPLRVLRLARFTVELAGFEAEPRTVALARSAAGKLGQVASERVREELGILFGAPNAAAGLGLLNELGVYPALWSGDAAAVPSAAGARRRLERLDRCAAELEAELRPGSVDRFVASQAALLAGLPRQAERLRDFHRRRLVSNRQARAIEALLGWTELPRDDPQRRWFLHRAGVLWPTLASYLGASAADAAWRATRGALVELARSDAEAIFAPRPLLDGHEIAELLAVAPGPRLGELAGRLRRAQIEGRVSTRDAAIEWLRKHAAAD